MAVHDNHRVPKLFPIPGSCLLALEGRSSLNVNEKYKKARDIYFAFVFSTLQYLLSILLAGSEFLKTILVKFTCLCQKPHTKQNILHDVALCKI